MRNAKLNVDMDAAKKRWGKIVENMGVTNQAKIASLCEYAEMHSQSLRASGSLNENAAYANGANTAGMGATQFPDLSGTPGLTGAAGSGDLGQSLLPASLKIAAHTPGLELVPTINVNSNRIDLLYFDWKYDDTNGFDDDERASTFKFRLDNSADQAALETFLRAEMTANGITELRGRISAPLYFNYATGINAVATGYDATVAPSPQDSKIGWLQFKGFSRIDGMPMFRAYTQENTASSGQWTFRPELNTFAATGSIASEIVLATITETATSGAAIDLDVNGSTANALDIRMVSVDEDFIDDFTTNRKAKPLTRGEWDTNEAGKIGPDSFTKSVEIGVAHVSAALRLSEIGDWKRMYGVDVVEETKAKLVNQIQQKISVEIVDAVKEMGLKNRQSLAAVNPTSNAATALAAAGITDGKIYDMSVSAIGGALGGENTETIARKLMAKITQASYYILTDGRIGAAEYIVTSGAVAGILASITNSTISNIPSNIDGKQLTQAGTIHGFKLYVDPYMAPTDLTVYLGKKGDDQSPGLKFLSYMLAETVEIVSENTMAARLYMYSRYAIVDFGHFPEKQYMAIKVEDVENVLI